MLLLRSFEGIPYVRFFRIYYTVSEQTNASPCLINLIAKWYNCSKQSLAWVIFHGS